MGIFGNKDEYKNKVYYRRKSLRLSSITLWCGCFVTLAIGGYKVICYDVRI